MKVSRRRMSGSRRLVGRLSQRPSWKRHASAPIMTRVRGESADVPITVIALRVLERLFTEWIGGHGSYTREHRRVNHAEYLDLPAGHAPTFTYPVQLGRAIR